MKIIHEGQKDHKCEFCDESFSIAGSLKTHIKRIHDIHKDQNCDICSKSFATKSNLMNHMKRAHKRKTKS